MFIGKIGEELLDLVLGSPAGGHMGLQVVGGQDGGGHGGGAGPGNFGFEEHF